MLTSWKIRLFWTFLFLNLILGAIKFLDRPEPGLNFLPKPGKFRNYSQIEAIKFSVYEVLFDYGIRVDWFSGDNYYKRVRIPADLPLFGVYSELAATFQKLGGHLIKAETNPAWDRMIIEVGLDGENLFELTLISDISLKRVAGKIAIVIDDFGYSFKALVKEFINLEQKVTLSILPGLENSAKIAEAAHNKEREVMIHLPMEPNNGHFNLDDFILLTTMSADEIKQRVQKAIASVPHAKGINNHMGSLATKDDNLLNALMSALDGTNLFFLDSRTDVNTRAYSWAQKMKIPCGINDTFLDSIQEEPFIRQQIYLLAEIASKHGQAIGIGHPKKLTLKVLQEELPKLERKGFKFVNISNVVK